MSISPNSSFYQGNVIPDVRLNFSVLIFEHVETVDFRLQCLYAPNHEDTYCHDSTKMIVNNTWLWPCRMLQFRGKEEEVRLPFSFGYSCFRIYGQSHYMVNVTLQPQNCRSSLIFTAPDDINLFPDIADFYKVPFVWSPMLIVDTSEDDGIWFRIEKPKTIYPYNVKIDLFKYLRIKDKPGLQLHDSFMISTPSLGYKIRNTVKGDYVAYAYVPKYDCRLVCPSSDLPSDVECRICQHTKLNFTIDTSKGDFFWKSLVAVEDSWVVIVIFLLGVFTVCFLGIASFLCFLRKKPNRSVYVELVERPTVLVLYSDDTTEHSHAVAKFADLLASSANASVRIDINELISTGSLPSRWLIESMGKASSVLLVLSQASEGILNGRKLVQRRPFPDMFSIACDLVIQDCTTHPSSKSKFATVRFPYSPQSVPYHLEMLGLQNFDVPKDLALLTAFLHRLSHSNVEQDMSNSSSLQTFMESLTAAQDYMKNNPDFFENMWQFETTTETLDIKDLPPKNDLTVQEINPDTEGLLLPDDESNDEGSYNSQGSYNILPPGSDDSDID